MIRHEQPSLTPSKLEQHLSCMWCYAASAMLPVQCCQYYAASAMLPVLCCQCYAAGAVLRFCSCPANVILVVPSHSACHIAFTSSQHVSCILKQAACGTRCGDAGQQVLPVQMNMCWSVVVLCLAGCGDQGRQAAVQVQAPRAASDRECCGAHDGPPHPH